MFSLLSLAISCVTPLFGIVFGFYGIWKNPKHWRTYIVCIALFFATIAYTYEPVGTPDLVRYFALIERVKKLTFFQALTYNYKGESATYIFNLICWFVGRLGDVHLLPALSVFSVYYIGLYITCRTGEIFKLSSLSAVAYSLFLVMSLDAYSLINNIRNIWAFSFVILAVFREIIEEKKDFLTLCIYGISVFFHPSAFILIIARLGLFASKRFKWLFLGVLFFASNLINFAYHKIAPVFGGFIAEIITKIYSTYYIQTNWSSIVANSRFYQVQRIVYMLLGTVVLVGILLNNRIIDKNPEENKINRIKKYMLYMFLLVIILYSCYPIPTPSYWRFGAAIIVASGASQVFSFENGRIKKYFLYNIFVVLIGIIMLYLGLWRFGSQNMISFIYGLFSNGLVKILFDIILF